MNVLRSALTSFALFVLMTFAQLVHATLDSIKSPPKISTATNLNGYRPMWWKEAVVYQVYPRSFKDSNGDGIGDLQGITSKLDYLQKLGVTVIWLSPHYDSPNVDNGYDIRNYRKVMSEFGTMKDFDDLLYGIKQRHMKLIIDLVVNHTSDEHHWFVESRKAKNNPYRDYYIWRSGKDGKPPNNYVSFFSEAAWKLDPATNQYYLHYFAQQQPDLNWDNPKVRDEVYSLMKFWLDKGVDGFRMDVIPFISKDQSFPDLTASQLQHPESVYVKGPFLHKYLQEMNRAVLSKYDVMTVGEAFGVTLDQTPLLVDERRHELNMILSFDIVNLTHNGFNWRNWTLPELKAIYARQNRGLDRHSWNTLFISNHDNPRAVSSFGDDAPAYRVLSAKLLATMLLTLKGTPFIYQGDELGMTNYPFKSIDDFNDIWARNGWKAEVVTGKVTADSYLTNLRKTSRDNARTPMQWDDSMNGGFTTAPNSWLTMNPNYKQINAKQQLSDPDSVYHYYRHLIEMRKNAPALIYGNYHDRDPGNAKIYAYTRTLGKDEYFVVLNFSRDTIAYRLPKGVKSGQMVISNLGKVEENASVLHLKGWEARVYKK